MSRSSALLVPLLALVLAGCGAAGDENSAEDFTGEQRQVAQVVEELEDAGEDRNARRICRRLLARPVIQRLRQGGQDCETAIARALDDADAFQLDVERVRITGDTATVRVQSGPDEEDVDTLRLVREDGRFKIAELGA